MDVCVDCRAAGEWYPQFPDGQSRRCAVHLEEWERHHSRWRSATYRARQRGEHEPPRPTYVPQLLADIYGTTKDRRVEPRQVDYLDGLINAVRRSKGPIDAALLSGHNLDREVLAAMSQSIEVLLDELNAVLWPEGTPPVRRREPPPNPSP